MNMGDKIKARRLQLKLTQQEIADYVGISKSLVSRWETGDISNMGIDKLRRLAGILQVDGMDIVNEADLTSKEIKATDYNTTPIPLLGTIAAGTPILATENIEEYFNIDSSIKADFALRIKGDSMINVGIHDKDIVFIKKQSTLENGQIGAILLAEDEKATLKRFYKADDHYILQPENNEMSPILVKDDVKILGKYVAVLHIESNS